MANRPIFDLTPMTRGAAADRKTVVATVEMKTRHLVVLIASILPCMVLTAALWGILGQYVVLLWPIVIGTIFAFVEGRTRSGMQVSYWQALRNRQQSSVGRFFIGSTEVDPNETEVRMVRRSSVPVEHPATQADIADIVQEPSGATVPSRKNPVPESAPTGWEDIDLAVPSGHGSTIPNRGTWSTAPP